jgi:hypothetical protein
MIEKARPDKPQAAPPVPTATVETRPIHAAAPIEIAPLVLAQPEPALCLHRQRHR